MKVILPWAYPFSLRLSNSRETLISQTCNRRNLGSKTYKTRTYVRSSISFGPGAVFRVMGRTIVYRAPPSWFLFAQILIAFCSEESISFFLGNSVLTILFKACRFKLSVAKGVLDLSLSITILYGLPLKIFIEFQEKLDWGPNLSPPKDCYASSISIIEPTPAANSHVLVNTLQASVRESCVISSDYQYWFLSRDITCGVATSQILGLRINISSD